MLNPLLMTEVQMWLLRYILCPPFKELSSVKEAKMDAKFSINCCRLREGKKATSALESERKL